MADVLDQPMAVPPLSLEPLVSVKSLPERLLPGRAFLDPAFLVAVGVYLATMLALVAASWRIVGGHFIYPLDDVYINMAVAKNFASHGVWGVTPFEFTSSTSSPLYILLLSAVYRLFGVNQYAPLVLSGLSGLGAIYVAGKMLSETVSGAARGAALVGFVLLAPLFAIGALGMEHSLHLLLALLFLWTFDDEGGSLWSLAAITALMCGARYEGVLMAAAATLLPLIRRRWDRAAVIAISAWLPVAIYAAFSRWHGGYWLPNSVAIKGAQIQGLGVGQRLLEVVKVTGKNCAHAPHLPLLLIAVLILSAALWKRTPKTAGLLAVVGGSGVLHLMAADVGWAFRYESYLIGVAVVAVASAWPSAWRLRRQAAQVAACFLILSSIVLVFRSCLAAELMPQYSKSIYLQQWQTARFLKAYYPEGAVAANDIGAITYVNDVHCFDMAGLASASVFEAKQRNEYTTRFLEQQTADRKTQLAVVYDSWFSKKWFTVLGGPPLPTSWIRVRRWTVPVRNQLGDRTISFYAMSPAGATVLKGQLKDFEPTLPKEITVSD